MQLNWLALAVPLFLLLMWLEYRLAQKKAITVHSFNESIANLNVGIAERVCDLLTTALFVYWYQWIFEHHRLFNIASAWWIWLLLFLATDFVWYWYHRWGHEVSALWGVHGIHHQSEDFNYTVSARITMLQAVIRGGFWSVLPLLGFDPKAVAIMLLIHGAYPFFTHTQLVGKLGWLEYLFVTPSHHRVHHSCNTCYLDKNYGDVLIIWDKLFGTFAPETETPKYGITKPLNSYSFLWQHFHFILELAVAIQRTKGIRQKLTLPFRSPEAIDPRIRSFLERKLLRTNHNQIVSEALRRNITINTTITLLVLFFTILFEHYIHGIAFALLFAWIILSCIHNGAMLEQKQWVLYLEYIRLNLVLLLAYAIFPSFTILALHASSLLACGIFHKRIKAAYSNYILT
jgi:sterol desaturase/sphingolipid hydroxylase (fatty acid hydroxylase superfamily)